MQLNYVSCFSQRITDTISKAFRYSYIVGGTENKPSFILISEPVYMTYMYVY
jgi:hypothetical protein